MLKGKTMKKEEIKNLIDMFQAANISKIHIKQGDFEIALEKQGEIPAPAAAICPPAPAPVMSAPTINITNEMPAQKSSSHPTLNSPMVGTFYQAPSPGAAAFVKTGQQVKKGEVYCIIEAMKIMNEIEAEFDCRILERLVEDGQPIEFGMALFEVEKL